MNNPLVSICIPTYNGEKFIDECIQSILTQTYQNLEIVVSDDSSSDGTLTILESVLSQSNVNYKIIFNENERGLAANWNNAIKNSNGKYIKFVFQDDVLKESCVSELVTIAESEPNLGLVYCKRDFIIEENYNDYEWIEKFNELHNSWNELIVQTGVLSGKEYLRDSAILNEPLNKIGEPTAVLILKTCFDELGYFDSKLSQLLDAEMWYRIMTKYNIGFVDEELCSFRLHSEQTTELNKASIIKDYEEWPYIFYKKFKGFLCQKVRNELNRKYHPIYRRLKRT